MSQAIILSAALVIALFVINSLLNHICGFDSLGNNSKVIEGTITIVILYVVIVAAYGNGFFDNGIPFADKLESFGSLTEMFRTAMPVFVLECTELISFTFVISLISSYFPESFGGSGMTGKTIRSVILVLIGIVVNNYFLSFVSQMPIFSYAITALQCFLSGAAIVITPVMLVGSLLKVNPKSSFASFVVEKLPQTKIGKAFYVSVSNSILLVATVMIFESQVGSVNKILNDLPNIIALFAPIVIMIIGIGIVLKSARN